MDYPAQARVRGEVASFSCFNRAGAHATAAPLHRFTPSRLGTGT
jgi:hypothetical protein